MDIKKLESNIIYEDNHLLIVNKEAGVLTQGDKTGDTTLIDLYKAYIKEVYEKPGNVFLGLVHRLDRPVSGIVVLAKTSKGLERMNSLLRTQEGYETSGDGVKTEPPKKTDGLVHWLIEDESRNMTTAFDKKVPEGKRSELQY